MNTQRQTESRIVIALDSGEREEYAFELARWLTPTQAQEILGLFVENEALLEHARSRQAREVLLTGSARELKRSTLERQIRAEAARVRELFEAASSRLGLPHRFETARGDILLESMRHAAGAQALVVTMTQAHLFGAFQRDLCRQLFEGGPPLVLLARHGWLSGRSVAVIAGESDDLLLEAGARIARHTDSPLIALTPDGNARERAAIRSHIDDKLRALGIRKFQIVAVNPLTIENIIAATRAYNVRLLVIPSPQDAEASTSVEQLLRHFSGALMFVRR